MKAHSEALRRRWSDPAYRERQTEANRRASALREAQLNTPEGRGMRSQAAKVGWRIRKKGRQ